MKKRDRATINKIFKWFMAFVYLLLSLLITVATLLFFRGHHHHAPLRSYFKIIVFSGGKASPGKEDNQKSPDTDSGVGKQPDALSNSSSSSF